MKTKPIIIWILAMILLVGIVSANDVWYELDDFNDDTCADSRCDWNVTPGGSIFFDHGQLVLHRQANDILGIFFNVSTYNLSNTDWTFKTLVMTQKTGSEIQSLRPYGSYLAKNNTDIYDGAGFAMQTADSDKTMVFDAAHLADNTNIFCNVFGGANWTWFEWDYNSSHLRFKCWKNSTVEPDFYFWNYSRASLNAAGSTLRLGFDGGGAVLNHKAYFDSIWLLYPANTMNISESQPINGSSFSGLSVDFNLTGSFANPTSCSLYINGTHNQTRSYAVGQDLFVNFSADVPEGGWIYNINCTDGTTIDVESGNKTFYMDTTDPILVTNMVNGTAIYSNVTAQFNLTDNVALHSLNISIDGISILSKILSGRVYNLNFSYDISNLSSGTKLMTVTIADGHTAKELKGDYGVKTGWGYIEYDLYGEGTIRTQLKDKSIFDKWKSERKKDRYTQVFTPNTPLSSIKLVEQSTLPIHIKHTPGYYNDYWIVTGNHWKDYVIEGEPNAKVSIERIDLYNVEVTISGLQNPKEIKFNSIGDLNIVTHVFSFIHTNITASYTTPVPELQEQSLTLRIEKPTGLLSTNATLYWNGTITNRTKVMFASYDLYTATFITQGIDSDSVQIPVVWNYNLTGASDGDSGNITFNQTVSKVLIDNCTDYHMRAINFSVRYQSNESELGTADIDGYFEIWVNSEDAFRPFNLTWRGGNDYGICISPNTTSYKVFGQVEYTATDYNIGTYYFSNVTFDNITEVVNLYVTNGSLVTFHVTDQDDDDVEDVFIHILRYNLPTDSYIVSEIVKTDSDGNALGLITLNTVWYKFMLIYDGELKLETEPTKITASPRNFRINLLDDYFDNFDDTQGITTELSFTNSTLNFAYTFINPEGTGVTACLDVTKRSINGDTLINNSCITAASGTILLNIGDNVGTNTFIGVGSITRDGDTFITDTESVSFDYGYKVYGISGLFVSFFLILTLALIGVWNPGVSVLFMIVGVVTTNLLGFFQLNWEILIAFIIIGVITMYRVSRK